MAWQYKVVSMDTLIPDSGDHDIAVSKEAAKNRKEKLSGNLEDNLNGIGRDGWELVSIFGEFGVFKKPAD